MKKLIALAVMAFATQAIATTFAGEPVVSSKQVIAPPPPPPVSFFRGNEFDIGAFATYVTGTNGGGSRTTRTFDDETLKVCITIEASENTRRVRRLRVVA